MDIASKLTVPFTTLVLGTKDVCVPSEIEFNGTKYSVVTYENDVRVSF
tara:strand:+ start:250 stop:393 length:144 start_codon:yes stop_codon:yes gene_type:complete